MKVDEGRKAPSKLGEKCSRRKVPMYVLTVLDSTMFVGILGMFDIKKNSLYGAWSLHIIEGT